MKRERNRLHLFLATMLGAVMVLSLAGCQAAGPSYPTKEITYLVPSPQGASTDQAARALTDVAAKYIGKSFTIKNNGAAGGTAAAAEVFAAKPDGYTIGMIQMMPLTMQPHLMGNQIPYKGPEDFTILHQLYTRANILAVKTGSKYKTLQDLVDDFKKGGRTEPFTFAGRGVGNAEHLTMEIFARKAGLEGKFKVVPFQNDGEAAAAVLGGHIEGTAFMFPSLKQLVVEKQLLPLASFIDFPGMEQYGIKSMKQLGYGFEWSPKHYNIAPKGTPKEIVAKLDDAFKKALDDPAFQDYVKKVGDFTAYLPGEQALTSLKAEFELEGTIAKDLGLIK